MTGRQRYAFAMASVAVASAALTAEAIRNPRVSSEVLWVMWGTHAVLIGGLSGGAGVWAWRRSHRRR